MLHVALQGSVLTARDAIAAGESLPKVEEDDGLEWETIGPDGAAMPAEPMPAVGPTESSGALSQLHGHMFPRSKTQSTLRYCHRLRGGSDAALYECITDKDAMRQYFSSQLELTSTPA